MTTPFGGRVNAAEVEIVGTRVFVPDATEIKSLFASFSEDKRRVLFFSEEKNQKTFISRRGFEDPGFGRKVYPVPRDGREPSWLTSFVGPPRPGQLHEKKQKTFRSGARAKIPAMASIFGVV